MTKIDAAKKRLESSRWSTRQRGMEELIELGEIAVAMEFALKESVPAVLDSLLEATFPEPTDLLVHVLTMERGPNASLASRYHLPRGNYLYAEDAIVNSHWHKGARMPIPTVEGLGLAYVRSISPVLERMLDARMVNLEEAKRSGAKSGGVERFVDQEERHTWSGGSKRAVVAAIALSRMDVVVDSRFIKDLLVETRRAMEDCAERRVTIAELTWVLFNLGDVSLDDLLSSIGGPSRVLPDVATTLLKRGQCEEVARLVRDFGEVYFVEDEFCFWPLLDYMHYERLADIVSYGRHPTQPGSAYLRARRLGLAPPPWWEWLQAPPN
jgi:hypothetical protein